MRQLTPSRKSPLKAMSRRGLPVLFAVALGSIFVSLLVPTAHAQAGPSLVYHQISAFTDPIIDGGAGAPILSRDGQRIAFARPPVAGDLVTRIFVVNFDGTGQIQIDSVPRDCFVVWLDISVDGSKVVYACGGGIYALPMATAAAPSR